MFCVYADGLNILIILLYNNYCHQNNNNNKQVNVSNVDQKWGKI